MNTSALLTKYLTLFEKNPTGLVFAPLAETYRKLGMRKEAFDILKKGLRHNPHYVLGLIVLAHCYFDEGNLEQSYKVLAPLTQHEIDNLMLQKLFAQVCYKMYAYKEALQAYKYVLFANPQDEEAKSKIKELEEQEQNYFAYLSKAETPPPVEKNVATNDEINHWKEMDNTSDFPKPISVADDKKVADYLKNMSVEQAESWTVKQWSVPESPTKTAMITETEPSVIDTNPKINLDSYENLSPSEEVPIVTHTLIDIFCAQKHYDKAIVLLEKVLKNNPHDERSKKKYQQLLENMNHQSKNKTLPPAPKNSSVKTSWDESKYQMLANKYRQFLDQLKDSGKAN